ncbi:MAG: DUF2461 domain-containing protein [Acidisphaera sp.]|nr:DUF2461 domain-containing protein [Acidisphaera sp.]MBV9812416.1 DUF2461 domain-containing protein [Acetobacteraceae bacterium]
MLTRNFAGFLPAGMDFLRELASNNDPAWFKPRRDEYETQVRAPAVALAADVLNLASQAKLPLDGDPAKAVFRIHRDVRFSPDKRPYKAHVGIAFTRSGRKNDPGILYVHIEPGACFLAAGFYRPEPAALAAIRQRIIADERSFLAAVKRLDAAGIPLEPDAGAAKRLPRGCEAVAGRASEAFVKARTLIVRRHVVQRDLAAPAFADAVVAFYREAQPLLAFGWRALGPAGGRG